MPQPPERTAFETGCNENSYPHRSEVDAYMLRFNSVV
jgi:hypothetical protein